MILKEELSHKLLTVICHSVLKTRNKVDLENGNVKWDSVPIKFINVAVNALRLKAD